MIWINAVNLLVLLSKTLIGTAFHAAAPGIVGAQKKLSVYNKTIFSMRKGFQTLPRWLKPSILIGGTLLLAYTNSH